MSDDDHVMPGWPEDPRVDATVRKAEGIVEVVLNAEYLMMESLQEFITAAGCRKVVDAVRFTPEQRMRLFLFDAGLGEEPDSDSASFAFLLEVVKVRSDLRRLPEEKILEALTAAYWRAFPPANPEEEPADYHLEFSFVRYAVAGHLAIAMRTIRDFVECRKEDDEDGE